MKDRFGVARCCCVSFCEDCCNGNAPTEWDVELLATDSACTTCNEEFGGVFTLARVSAAICKWRFIRETSWQPECSIGYAAYGDYMAKHQIDLQIRCIDEKNYRIFATYTLNRQYQTSTEKLKNSITGLDVIVDSSLGVYGDSVSYQAVVKYSDFNCNNQEEYELPFLSGTFFRSFRCPIEDGLGNGFKSFSSFYDGSLPIGEQFNGTFGQNAYWKPICEPPAVLKLTSVP